MRAQATVGKAGLAGTPSFTDPWVRLEDTHMRYLGKSEPFLVDH